MDNMFDSTFQSIGSVTLVGDPKVNPLAEK